MTGFSGPDDAHRQADGFADAVGKVGQRILRDDLPLVDDDHAVAHVRHFMQDVGGEHHGVVLAQAGDQLADLDDLLGIKADGRLVHDDDLGVAHQRLRHAHALLVALERLRIRRWRTSVILTRL